MKRYTTLILVGIIVLLAAVLTGVLVFMKNQPPQMRAVQPIVEIAKMEPDSSQWGINFPNQWATLQKTADNNIDTTYGGSSKFSWLEHDPRQKILFAGYPFSMEYNDDRGHMNCPDRRARDRPPEPQAGRSQGNPRHLLLVQILQQPRAVGRHGHEGLRRHDVPRDDAQPRDTPSAAPTATKPARMRLIVTNPALDEALKAQGKDWTTFTRQEMRTVVCANCHVEYYFVGDGKYLTFPWENGTNIDQIVSYYEANGFTDWDYPETATPMLKAQHPEYEIYTAGSTHYNAGVACADCHMPYVRDGASKYSTHDVHSPLLNPELACGQCHTDTEAVVRRVTTIQDQVAATKQSTEDALIDAINALKTAAANPDADAALLDQARALHRKAQFMWDFVSAENSTGFHNPSYTLRILAESTNLARQVQMLASQAANDPALLQTGTYYLETQSSALP